MSFRLPESELRYRNYCTQKPADSACSLCTEKSIVEFQYWRIIKNNFPYDRIAIVHNMIIPKRHAQELELTSEEMAEYTMLKFSYINDNFTHMLEPVPKIKSMPDHFHVHLITSKYN